MELKGEYPYTVNLLQILSQTGPIITVSGGPDDTTMNALQAGWMVTIVTHFFLLFFL